VRVIYDAGTDTLSIILSDQPVAESDEEKPGVILDFDAGGNVVAMEILDASFYRRRTAYLRRRVFRRLRVASRGR
jgi:uncharacterized protein YuzE